MAFSGGTFEHPKSVIDFAYTLIRDYEAHERQLDREVTHLNIWHKIRSKCNNRYGWYYAKYGAQGIRVCDRWDSSLKNFTEDMGPVLEGAIGVKRLNKLQQFTPENTVWKF